MDPQQKKNKYNRVVKRLSRLLFLLRTENAASTSLNLPLRIAIYQIKDNDTRIIVQVYFFQKIWLKNSYLAAMFFLLRKGSKASAGYSLPLSIAL